MKKLSVLILICISFTCKAQDTFSIVAVDSVTGEIGSAGASCVPVFLPAAPHGAQIISDVIPGTGAIHTQAYWIAANQQNAHARMLAGDSAQQIIYWLALNDAQSNSSIRQYGIVGYNGGHPLSAAYTGVNCNDYKNHITGPGYSIQGNILLGQEILDSMEARYLNTAGTLADKLMAALQGANVTGADTRCAVHGLSSLSSFIRVALPTDSIGGYHLDLYMAYPNGAAFAVDPIDSLQTLYDNWLFSVSVPEILSNSNNIPVYQDENEIVFDLARIPPTAGIRLYIYDTVGKNVLSMPVSGNKITLSRKENNLSPGMYVYRFYNGGNFFTAGKIIF